MDFLREKQTNKQNKTLSISFQVLYFECLNWWVWAKGVEKHIFRAYNNDMTKKLKNMVKSCPFCVMSIGWQMKNETK